MIHLYISRFNFEFCSKQERFLYTWRSYVRLRYSEFPPESFLFMDITRLTGSVLFDSLQLTLHFLRPCFCLTVYNGQCLIFRPCPLDSFTWNNAFLQVPVLNSGTKSEPSLLTLFFTVYHKSKRPLLLRVVSQTY